MVKAVKLIILQPFKYLSMEVYKNFSLKSYNTFGINALARFFVAPATIEEMIELLKLSKFKEEKKLILGSGSNVLFINDFDGLVIHIQMKGISIVSEFENEIIVKASGGEIWDEFVEWTVLHGLCGIENLSLIPGTVGACPIQNIGAYGVEVGECIEKVEAIDLYSLKEKVFSKEECQFAYRNSVFKNQLKNQIIITSVYFKLSKIQSLKTHYGAVEEELNKTGESGLTAIRKAIINIRESKLPNPSILPNAGSFFKNPVVSENQASILKNKFPEMSSYKAENNKVKLAAGWLIDYLGWKGKSFGGVAVHDKQALVLVNKNHADGKEIVLLGNKIKADVYNNFGVELEFEVNIID